MTRPFEHIRVLDLSNRLSGAFAARFFGDFGADVILAEPAEGHSLRHEPPFLDDDPGIENAVLHAYANWNKRSMLANDPAVLTQLVASADIVITTTADLGATAYGVPLQQNAPADVIHLSITPHGLDGPLAQANGNHLTACARSGWAYINAYQDESPLQLPTQQTGYVAGIAGFVTAAAALYRRRRTGGGEQIDVSEVEALALTCHPWGIAAIFEGRGWCRGSRQGGKPRGTPGPLWETKDGLINFGFGDWHNWPEAMHLIGLPAFADTPTLIPDQGRHSQDLSGVIDGAAQSVKNALSLAALSWSCKTALHQWLCARHG